MRILYCYRYGILGGVCTQLINRLDLLAASGAIQAELLFGFDYGISETLGNRYNVHYTRDLDEIRATALDSTFDLAVVVDTPEFLDALANVPALPIVLEVHTTVEHGLSYLEDWRWPIAGCIVPSLYSKRMLEDRFGLGAEWPIEVMPNSIEPGFFPTTDIDPAPTGPVFAWVGKLDNHKNWKGFLQTARRISERVPGAEFWLVGGDTAPQPVQSELIEEIFELGLTRSCRWLPRIEYQAMHLLYAAVQQSGGAAIVTSQNESFGMSVLEALLCGCPVVASDVGAIPELAPGKPYLRLYPYGDYRSAAAEAQALNEGPAARRARQDLQNDREWFLEQYSSVRVTERYPQILQKMLERADSETPA